MEQLFDENFIKELGLDKLPEKERDEIISSLLEIFSKRLFIRLIKNLNQEQAEKLNKIMEDENNVFSVIEFLAKNVPDYDLIVEDEIKAFKTEAIDFVKNR